MNQLLVEALCPHRDRQPCRSVLRLDPIPAPPVTLRELDVVEEDELVCRAYQVEVTLPGNGAGLDDGDAL